MPELFSLPEISIIQAAGIFILSKLIFTPGFGKGHDSRRSRNSRDWGDKFRHRMRSKSPHFEEAIIQEDDKTGGQVK